MSTRLARGGRLPRPLPPAPLLLRRPPYQGFAGDTLASALLANGQMMVGRSFKYHRPRGLVASGHEEPNGLVNLGAGERWSPTSAPP
jgi:sarcosine oxidase subunit alpha